MSDPTLDLDAIEATISDCECLLVGCDGATSLNALVTAARTLLAEVRRLTAIVADDPDGVLDESIAACDILGIDRTGDYDYLGALRAVVKERDVAVDAFHRCRQERDEARAALARSRREERDGSPSLVAALSLMDDLHRSVRYSAQERRRIVSALQSARVEGARVMLDKVRERAAALRVTVGAVCEADTCPDVDMDDEIHDLWLTLDQIDALDPTTVVGSGS